MEKTNMMKAGEIENVTVWLDLWFDEDEGEWVVTWCTTCTTDDSESDDYELARLTHKPELADYVSAAMNEAREYIDAL